LILVGVFLPAYSPRISKVCDETLLCNTIAMVYGESQIGKTASLKEYARRNNQGQTVYPLMPASAGVQSMVRAIAEACHG
jgi:DNA transposition AAA+ family ATPase